MFRVRRQRKIATDALVEALFTLDALARAFDQTGVNFALANYLHKRVLACANMAQDCLSPELLEQFRKAGA